MMLSAVAMLPDLDLKAKLHSHVSLQWRAPRRRGTHGTLVCSLAKCAHAKSQQPDSHCIVHPLPAGRIWT